MDDAVILLDTPELRERSIDNMVEELRAVVATVAEASVHARANLLLAEIMPVFIRGLDRERKVFMQEAKAGEIEAVDRMLSVMTQPLTNMVGATLVTLIPCRHLPEPCESCVDLRMGMMRNVLENLFQGTAAYVTCPVDQTRYGKLRVVK